MEVKKKGRGKNLEDALVKIYDVFLSRYYLAILSSNVSAKRMEKVIIVIHLNLV